MGERRALADVARARADHDGELDLPIRLCRTFGDHDVVIRSDDAGSGLVEQDRLLGHRHAGFGSMVGVVEPDGDEIANLGDAGADPGRAADRRQGFRLELGQAGQGSWPERICVDVAHDLAQVPQFSASVDQRRFFLTHRAISCEFHKPSVEAPAAKIARAPGCSAAMHHTQTLAGRLRQSLILALMLTSDRRRRGRIGVGYEKLRAVPWISGWTNPILSPCFARHFFRFEISATKAYLQSPYFVEKIKN